MAKDFTDQVGTFKNFRKPLSSVTAIWVQHLQEIHTVCEIPVLLTGNPFTECISDLRYIHEAFNSLIQGDSKLLFVKLSGRISQSKIRKIQIFQQFCNNFLARAYARLPHTFRVLTMWSVKHLVYSAECCDEVGRTCRPQNWSRVCGNILI